MKRLIQLCSLAFCAALCHVSTAKENEEWVDKIGSLEVIDSGSGLKFSTDDSKYFVWTGEVIEKLKPLVGKRVQLKGVAIPTEDGNLKHIVWLQSAEVPN